MNKYRKFTDVIFKFSNKDTYRCAMINLNECLSKNVCFQDKCDRYRFCAGNNLSHINLYVEQLETALNEIKEYAVSDKLLKILSTSKINEKGETHYDLIRNDILQIIGNIGGNDDK